MNARTTEKHGRAVLFFLSICLLCIFGASFWYRLHNPSLTMQRGTSAQQSDMMGGIGQYMERLEQNPQDTEALFFLGRTFLEMGAWEQAAQFLNRLVQADPDNIMGHYFLGIARFQMKEYQTASEQFEKVISMDPDTALAHFNLGILYKHFLDQPSRAQTHFERVLEIAPDNQEVLSQARNELAAPHGTTSGN